jgi:hypothetical protein
VAVESPPESDRRLTLIYEESVRAIEQQQTALDNLRSRTGVLIAAAAIASSFLGGQALRSGGLSVWSGLALGALLVVGVAAIVVLVPRKGWFFSNNVGTLISGYIRTDDPATLGEMEERLAKFNQGRRDANQLKLESLYFGFRVASGALVLEVVFWLIDLGTR